MFTRQKASYRSSIGQVSTEFDIQLKPSAKKDFKKFTFPIQRELAQAINALVVYPYPKGYATVKGRSRLYRITVGVYRLVYSVNLQDRQIFLVLIDHRDSVYKRLKSI